MATYLSPSTGSDASNFTRQFNVETIGGDQRQRLVEMLRSQALNQPQGQMVSGWYVAPNWTQNLNQALQTGLGVFGGAQLDKERAQKTAEALKRFEGVEEEVPMQNIPGVSNQGAAMAEGQSRPEGAPMQSQANPEMMPRQTRMRPLSQDEQDMALLNLAQVNPTVGGIYGQLLGTRATRAERAAEKADQRAWQAAENEKNRQSREDMLRLAHSMRPQTGGEKWTYDAGSDTWVMPPNAQFPMGRSTPNVSKVGALKNLNYLADKFTSGWTDEKGNEKKPILETTPQGGWLGITGFVGAATDTQAGKAFDNNVEQLSNELRKIHRIPGEGTLSDKEQAQYGIQLPKKTNSRELNEQIIQDMKIRGVNAVMPGGVNPLQPAPTGNADGFTIRPKK